jgi:t-SNARE complex subunit (syntaxin)
VQERENEIREIETGIHELNEITRDLATIITEQGTMVGESSHFHPFHSPLRRSSVPPNLWDDLLTLTASFTDNIESNISSVEVNVREANGELTIAADSQRKAGNRGAWLMIIVAVVVTIILIAVRVLLSVRRHVYP